MLCGFYVSTHKPERHYDQVLSVQKVLINNSIGMIIYCNVSHHCKRLKVFYEHSQTFSAVFPHYIRPAAPSSIRDAITQVTVICGGNLFMYFVSEQELTEDKGNEIYVTANRKRR